jgi:hypothetical protein
MTIPTHDSESIVACALVVAVVGVISALIMTKLAQRVYPTPRDDMAFARRGFIGAGVFFAVALALWIMT